MPKKEPYVVKKTTTFEEFRNELAAFLRVDDENFAQRDPVETQIFTYMNRYLKTEPHCLKAGTIVCESPYTCLNYLEDYANYYSRTYTDYKKECKRLHFFSKGFSAPEFEKMIVNPDHDNWKSYLGCMVVKPIPRGKIGVTYLNTYDHAGSENGRGKYKERHYKCLTNKTINLFGKELSVTTMPFKEQDGAVASCATTALWMAFQKTAEIFNSTAPSLSEITILAGGGEDGAGRIFPSKGLSTFQVLTAISKMKMQPVIEEFFNHENYFKAELHAYVKGDIPVLLGMEGIEGEKNTFNHLVTVNGYRYAEDKFKIKTSQNNIRLLSESIQVFYVNDDQIGPFARVTIRNNAKTRKIEIETSWEKRREEESESEKIVVSPGFLIVPLTPSIKVQFRDIYISYLAISRLYTTYISKDKAKIIYDIYITKSNDYKKNLLKEKQTIFTLSADRRSDKLKRILTTSLPKYIWVIEARDDSGVLLFDFIYDTVELRYDYVPIMVNVYSDDVDRQIEEHDEYIRNSFCSEHIKFKKSILRNLIVMTKKNTDGQEQRNKDTKDNTKQEEKSFIENFRNLPQPRMPLQTSDI